jgi:hypothetical protein
VLSAFPDHRHTRQLFDHDRLSAVAPALADALPTFPSPPYDGSAPGGLEQAQWSAAIDAGTAASAANSLVVVASRTGFDPEACATYWSQGRRAALSATNRIVTTGQGAAVHRARSFPEAHDDGPIRLNAYSEPLLDGRPMPAVLAQVDDLAAAALLLRSWSTLVDASVTDDAPVPWDLIPRNVMVRDDGELTAFDQEWLLDPTPDAAELIVDRGAFWLASDLLLGTSRPPWLGGTTVGDAADIILRLTGRSRPGDWLTDFIAREALHVSHIWLPVGHGTRHTIERRERKNMTSLSNASPASETGPDAAPTAAREVIDSLSAANADLRAQNEALRLELRHAALAHRDDTMGLVAESETLKDRLNRSNTYNRRIKARAADLQEQVTAMKASRTWRLGRAVIGPFASLARMFRR